MAAVGIHAAETADIVAEIRDGLEKQPENVKNQHRQLLQYLQMSDQELIAALPLKKTR